MRADVVARDSGVAQPWRVAAGVGAGLPRVRSRVWLLKKGLGQDFFPPRAGLRVHHRVEESLEIRVEILGDMDDLLSRRGRDGSRVHFPTWRWQDFYCKTPLQRIRAGGSGSHLLKAALPTSSLPPPPVLPQIVTRQEGQKIQGSSLLLRDTKQSSSNERKKKIFRPLFQRPSSNPKTAASSLPRIYLYLTGSPKADEARPSQAPTESYAIPPSRNFTDLFQFTLRRQFL